MGHLRQPSASTFRPRTPSTAAPRRVAIRSPRLHAAIRLWHHLAPALAVVMVGAGAVAVGHVWFADRRHRRVHGKLPAWPTDPAPAIVVGEVHHPVAVREVAAPQWLVIPELGLYTGFLVCGARGSGKTSACHAPGPRQILG